MNKLSGAANYLCGYADLLRHYAAISQCVHADLRLTVSVVDNALDCEVFCRNLDGLDIPQALLDAIGHCNEARFLVNRAREV